MNLTIISTLFGVASVIGMIFQQIRMAKIKKIQVDNLRSSLISCRLIMAETDRILKNCDKYGVKNNETISKLRAIHSNSCVLIRSFFNELSKVDLPYNKNKLLLYVSLDIITSQWLWKQAALYIDDDQANNLNMPELPINTPDYMLNTDITSE